ncbi:glycosyltransferase family 2 protein [Acidiferrimicrobium sp. IK]|uniref:glycosyltransferase n=1 Tax=Acidiferrimicrobium sp. IK TaxID=2871700 RepID=UPI0021CB7D4F|nr:glycosyltransferase family 2 protein [Acidiferrimicrobium sp. IK]MCU4185459.1 glycosyltransferase family 2 protein [Acidiferrimicrobium sp. IK]
MNRPRRPVAAPLRAGVGVVVPARDEEERLASCLEGLARAASALESAGRVTVLVVLDSCQDRTEAVARSTQRAWARRRRGPALRLTATAAGNVGAARAHGVARLGAGWEWMATTDADSVVPDHWLAHQLAVRDTGADAWVGTVTMTGLYHPCAAAWDLRGVSHHPHVHGANMGWRPEAYDACGGFTALTSGEDVDLARRLAAGGWRVVRGLGAPVATSGRVAGRAPDGFAADRAAGLPPPADFLLPNRPARPLANQA